ncbi:glycosyltransferase [Naasia sp. SYSU D00057]|uniref:glycosyltransferase n=1 Tax=Naasia sp. SYSU D00057 TaxID=2817380 RepID=UPI001B307C22|nr:glycosyltransferase [Naasia sp. SYSU D00057]
MKKGIIAALAVSAGAGHFLYPVVLTLAASLSKRTRDVPAVQHWPGVTVIVPAYLESGVIGEKVRNIETNGYLGEVQILVVADGDPETARAAEAAGAEVLALPSRGGKSQALNAGLAAARHEWVVLTDANAMLEAGAIQLLTRRLGDSAYGAVAGEKLEGTGGELSYWKFSSWLKRNESLFGSTNMDGALCAVRRSAWRPIPADISCDDFWISLDIAEQGYRVGYEPMAIVREESIGSLKQSWERRTRVLGSALWVIWVKRRLLLPRYGSLSASLWGHKLWRSTLGPLSHAALLAVAVAAAPKSKLAALFLTGHVLAGASLGAELAGIRVPRIAHIPSQVMFLQAVAFGGMARFARRDRAVQWKKPAR